MEKFIVNNPTEKAQLIDAIMALAIVRPMVFEWKQYRKKRSNSANNLYWLWLTDMAKFFSTPKTNFEPEDMHDLMRHEFLGYEEVVIGHTVLKPKLKSTADDDTAEFCEYMQQVDHWSIDHGCSLPRPEDNFYSKYKEAQA